MMYRAASHCYGPGDVCSRCGAVLVAPNQICRGADNALDEVSALIVYMNSDDQEPLTRRDWRLLLQQVRRGCAYLANRALRPTSKSDGTDARNLDRLRRLEPVLARAAGEE